MTAGARDEKKQCGIEEVTGCAEQQQLSSDSPGVLVVKPIFVSRKQSVTSQAIRKHLLSDNNSNEKHVNGLRTVRTSSPSLPADVV
jgi:hypothetical protein